MKQAATFRLQHLLPGKKVIVLALIVCTVAAIASAFSPKGDSGASKGKKQDSIESVRAFAKVYQVITSPRCMNCHPSGDVPLQGEDSHLHTMLPRRGEDGKGVYAMKCSNCHQPQNVAGLHTPPGNPKWQLPPADMKMVFQGKTARELALQIMDYNRNGHKNKAQLLDHANDTLVKAGWHPGEGRALPPLSYVEFRKAWYTWIEKGGYAPR